MQSISDLKALAGRMNAAIMLEVEAELSRQIARWGIQRHEPLLWNAILGEEVGEVNKAILETWFQGRADADGGWQYRKELIQVAAVAISAIRAFDLISAEKEQS